AAVILAVGTSARERNVLLGAVVQQRGVQELVATVGVQTHQLEWQALLEPAQRRQHGLSPFVTQRGTADPTGGHVHQRQRVQKGSCTGPAAMGDQSTSTKPGTVFVQSANVLMATRCFKSVPGRVVLRPRFGRPSRDEASARSIVDGLIRATRWIISAEI